MLHMHVQQSNDPAATKKAALKELFGSENLVDAKIQNVRLARHSNCTLPAKKGLSLSQKNFSIPQEFLHYYPNPVVGEAKIKELEGQIYCG